MNILSQKILVTEAKRGVEFHHPTRKTSRIWRKVGNRSFLMGTEGLREGLVQDTA